ncbi:Rab2/RabB-family small GTPase [Ceraceosorus guamensis]|uniref:Rab2/RabB-family small GTPase n=1 Tax=Ceraceosorus guamensis TaxID=1522189 RepID=A0A316W0F6_9BASI|nr:Rab2/RabB-family small GTPase [Ceraceosorus guamensis]PWN43397.1 Rab2/RabB-family small GTPase [Ceraceosorus guamensis]
MSTSWDYLTKFILVGDSSVGKSSILIRLTEQRWLAATDPTVGVEFGSHTFEISGELVRANVWDTAGSEAFRSITQSYYRGAAGALVVYNVTHRDSFLHAAEWLRDVRSLAEDSVTIILVGNMVDLAEEQGRQVTTEEGEDLAKREGLLFVETSAKTGKNVEEAFKMAATEIHRKFIEARDRADASGAGSLMKRGGRSAAAAAAAAAGHGDVRVSGSGPHDGADGKGCCSVM